MKLLETKTIKIGDKDYPIKKSARTYLKFEELSGHSIDHFDSSMREGIYFFYSCLWGGGLRISYDEFLDLIDDEDINILIVSFINLMSEPTEKKQKAR
jgi:hypothetical protein